MHEDKLHSLAHADAETSLSAHWESQEWRDRVRFSVWLGWGVLAFTVIATAFIVWRYAYITQAIDTNKSSIQTEATDRAKAVASETDARIAADKQVSEDLPLDRFIKEKFNPVAEMLLAAKATNDAQQTALSVLDSTTSALLKQQDDWRPLIIQHRQLWFMYENGLTNWDSFFNQKGYYAPTDPRSQGQSPAPKRR
jgi:hypothetical protein